MKLSRMLFVLPVLIAGLSSCSSQNIADSVDWRDDAETIYIFESYSNLSTQKFKNFSYVSDDLTIHEIFYHEEGSSLFVKTKRSFFSSWSYDEFTREYVGKVLDRVEIGVYKYSNVGYCIEYKT